MTTEFKGMSKVLINSPLDSIESAVSVNADNLIAMGKKAWLKQRRALHKVEMTEEQQEWEVALIEKRRLENTSND